jgi:Sulfatase
MGLFDFLKKQEAPKPAPRPMLGAAARPDPRATNNFIIVTLDSCRYDSFVEAAPKTVLKLGTLERRWAYASWTAPSHYNLLTGLLPHTSPPNVYASDYYKEDFFNYNRRLGAKGVEFGKMVPGLWFPGFLRNTLGYSTHARVSLPVLNPRTGINRDFDSFQLMDKHNDMRSMLPTMKFEEGRPAFYMLNVGETHYPYAKPDEDSSMWPRISGVNGVFKSLDSQIDAQGNLIQAKEAPQFFDQDKLDQLRARQVDTVRYLDKVFEELFDLVPKNTYIVVTADHGELFGEGGYFGHGPIQHDKVFEVPFLEGMIR